MDGPQILMLFYIGALFVNITHAAKEDIRGKVMGTSNNRMIAPMIVLVNSII